ncbi:MAG: hypothetical protein LBQ03_02340 [Puniceicoccales bacterium]|jgi:hypothetical protein|nr:hypothetical protein [Puniceicoccales bacterium]
MNKKLCIVLSLGLFGMSTFGRPGDNIIKEVRDREIRLNSGNLPEDEYSEKLVELLNFAANNFGSLPDGIKNLFNDILNNNDVGNDIKDKIRKNVGLNILRLYAFPNNPMKIGTALDNLIYRSGTTIFKDRNLRTTLLDKVRKLDVENNNLNRFQEIINAQKSNYDE